MPATLSGHTTLISGAIKTYNQMGGHGLIWNTVLAVPVHLNDPLPADLDDPAALERLTGPYNSLEFVVMGAPKDGEMTRIGEHEQGTDEIYLVVEGQAILTTNGRDEMVSAGDLVIAPKGTRHSVATEGGLAFLVVELRTPTAEVYSPTVIKDLRARATTEKQSSASGHPALAPYQQVRIDLSTYFSAPWGTLTLVHIPPCGATDEYVIDGADELLFQFDVRRGCATVKAGGRIFESGMQGVGMFAASPSEGLSVLVPAGMPRHMKNRASSPLWMLSLEVRRALAAGVDPTKHTYQEAVV